MAFKKTKGFVLIFQVICESMLYVVRLSFDSSTKYAIILIFATLYEFSWH